MNNLVSRFILGFKAPIVGFRLILTNKKLMRLSIAPFIVSLVLVILGLLFGYELFTKLFLILLPFPITSIASFSITSGVFSWLIGLITKIIGYTLFAILWILLALILVNIICIPFHSLLAEQALISLNVTNQNTFSLARWIKTCVRMFFISITRTIIILIIGFVSFLISIFIPGLGLITGFVGLLIIISDCLDYSLEILEFGLIKRFVIFKKYIVEFTGFCCSFGALPGINLLLLPVAIVGASWLVATLKINQEV